MKNPTFAIFLFLLPFLCLGYTNVEPPPTFAKNVLTDNKTIDAPKNIFTWRSSPLIKSIENSKVMYNKLYKAVPCGSIVLLEGVLLSRVLKSKDARK
jgi:hypothetical protein